MHRARIASSSLACVLLLAACGTDSGNNGSSSTPSSTSQSSSTAASPTSTQSSPTGSSSENSPTSSGGSGSSGSESSSDKHYSGKVVGEGLTCTVFMTDDGGKFNLVGDLPPKVRQAARQRGESVNVKVTGHVVRKAMSTCSLPVLKASQVDVG